MGEIDVNKYDNVSHQMILGKLTNKYHHQESVKALGDEVPQNRVPHAQHVRNNAQRWVEAGQQAADIADGLDNALKNLTEKQNGWSGKGAEAFAKSVKEIVRFTREYAHTCDEKHPKPKKDEGDSNFKEPPPEQKSMKQVLNSIGDAIETAQKDGKLKGPPWWRETMWVKAYNSGWGFGGRSYEVRKGDGDGSVLDGSFDHDDIKGKYEAAGAATTEYTGSGHDDTKAHHETGNAWQSGGVTYTFPKDGIDYEKFFFKQEYNKDDLKDDRATAKELFTAYNTAWGDLPEAPQDLKMPFSEQDKGDFGGGGGGAGGGGAGGMPPGGGPGGGPGPGDMPKPPKPPDVKPPEPPKPPDVDPPKPPKPPEVHEPPNPKPPGPPGGPDTRNPGPWDPSGPGTGGGGGGYDPGKIDSGTEGARVGGFDPSTGKIGPVSGVSPGGAAGGVGPGGAFGGSVPLSAGGGAGGMGPGGAGAGAGAGGAGAGGRGGGGMGMGGMMPMGGMGGGAGAGEGGDQDRTTWLEEDEDVWGGNDDAPPPVLGGGL